VQLLSWTGFWWESSREGDYSGDKGINGRIDTLEVWIGFNWLRLGTRARSCEYGDELSVSDATVSY
jgi:hypothetical protein